MDLYGVHAKSWPQKLVILSCELGLIALSYNLLFGGWGTAFQRWLGWHQQGDPARRAVIFAFSLIVFARTTYMLLVLLHRRIPLEEAFSVPLGFGAYYVGFALFVLRTGQPLNGWADAGIALFSLGSLLNTVSEILRDRWKRRPENAGHLYTSGLFAWSRHPNYLGDVLWVAGYAMVSANPWAWLVPIGLFCFFAFYNVPKLDAHLRQRYPVGFPDYASRTAKLIPFVY